MSIFRKIELLIGGLLLAAVILLSAYSLHLRNSRANVQQDYQQASGNASAATTAAKELKTVVIEKENAHAALDQALARSPEWADEPVPADVADLLRHDTGSARAVP
ncbi:Rz-like spanin [Xylella phage Prado]|uniref:I-spanin n=1 Tax=Xylella phage Prado TaxID=1415146 RepID=V5Q7X5_9CAUD|nr:Rz-like spanin [Xylella phage Prado]AHB12198.1 i-spanin [Xylella phage Prado]